MAPCGTVERVALFGRDVRAESEGVLRELGLERRDDPMTNLGSLGFPVEDLQRVRLDVRPGFEPSAKPPVRIFVGTEPAQYRPERILVWSIEQVRDPSRVYEITLMRELPGFDRRRWTTSFTNYRFLIPHLAGGEGRAIYNDEDQIYLSDPAELFDAQMQGHGVLAVSPQDTSVMLVDCARMTSVWPLAACFSESKNQLLARGREIPELFGSLGVEWNARDQEYRDGETRCLHYTTLHTQPWRPFPERFVYYEHPQAHLWFELERSANQAGFQLSTRDEPSPSYARTLDLQRQKLGVALSANREMDTPATDVMDVAICRLISDSEARSLLTIVPGSSKELETCEPQWGCDRIDRIGLAKLVAQPRDQHQADGVLCLRGLDEIPLEDLPWVVDELAGHAKRFVLAYVRAAPARSVSERGGPPTGDVGMPDWWQVFFEHAVARRPGLRWEIVFKGDPDFPSASLSVRSGGAFVGKGLPSVWVLQTESEQDTDRAMRLAAKLGWPTEKRSIRERGAPEPPWPDLVIASGSEGASVARHIRERAAGVTRVVHFGVEGANPISSLDLSVVPSFAGLLSHPRRIQTAGLLPRITEAMREQAAAAWKDRVGEVASPRLAVLLSGESARHGLSQEGAGELARGVVAVAEARGMSILVLEERGMRAGVVEAFRSHVGAAALWCRPSQGEEAPLAAMLDLADAFVVCGGSAENLSEVCATGKPVFIHAPDESRGGGWTGLTDAVSRLVVARADCRPKNRRGTTRPQQWLEYFCARLLASGRVVPVSDLGVLHGALIDRGLAQMLGEKRTSIKEPRMDDADVVARIHALLGVR